MPDDTRNHHVSAHFLGVAAWVGGSGSATASALDDEGEDIAEDEDPGVEAGFQPGKGGAQLDDDVLEGEVDGGGNEGGSDDETADLDLKTVARPRIVV